MTLWIRSKDTLIDTSGKIFCFYEYNENYYLMEKTSGKDIGHYYSEERVREIQEKILADNTPVKELYIIPEE